MTTRVTYELADSIATITMDDGKVNALSPDMLGELDVALDRAVADGAVVVLTGRDGILSAGFDLKVLSAGGPDAVAMLRAGFKLSERLLSFSTPVVVACPGHAMAMGVFLLLSGDFRIGAAGPYKIRANEVAIGMTMPRAAVEILRQRLTPAAFTRATLLSETFTPDNAIEAGLVDRVVDAIELLEVAHAMAAEFAALDIRAHSASNCAPENKRCRHYEPALKPTWPSSADSQRAGRPWPGSDGSSGSVPMSFVAQGSQVREWSGR